MHPYLGKQHLQLRDQLGANLQGLAEASNPEGPRYLKT